MFGGEEGGWFGSFFGGYFWLRDGNTSWPLLASSQHPMTTITTATATTTVCVHTQAHPYSTGFTE